MLDVLLALTVLAAAAPKVDYKPDPARVTDVGAVDLAIARRHPCFGIVRASVLLSSRKSDRSRVFALSVTVADFPGLETIDSGTLDGTPLKLVNVRNGDVACTDYQCPPGSTALFEVSAEQRQKLASGDLPLKVSIRDSGDRCAVNVVVPKSTLDTLDAWAAALPKAMG